MPKKEPKNDPNLIPVNLFRSISGEISHFPQGHLCGFIRLKGCNLTGKDECPYCDTTHEHYEYKSKNEIVNWAVAAQKKLGMICITGGEPLLHKSIVGDLLYKLNRSRISIETNGTIEFSEYIGFTNLVVDYKMHYLHDEIPNDYFYLTKNDVIKFVVASVVDTQKAMSIQKRIQEKNKNVKFAYSVLVPNELAIKAYDQHLLPLLSNSAKRIYEALQEEGLVASINIQIHKLLNFR